MAESRKRKLPTVRLACFCDQVIQGNDSVLTIVRIIDRVVIEFLIPEEVDVPKDLRIPYRVDMAIMLDEVTPWKGESVELWARRPGGRFERFAELPLAPRDDGSFGDSANLILKADLNARYAGLWEFELRLENRRVLKRALTLEHAAKE